MIYLYNSSSANIFIACKVQPNDIEIVGYLKPEDVNGVSGIIESDNEVYKYMCEEDYFKDCYNSYKL